MKLLIVSRRIPNKTQLFFLSPSLLPLDKSIHSRSSARRWFSCTSFGMSDQKDSKKEADLANDFITFMTHASSQFHAVAEVTKRLTSKGFEKISETSTENFTNLKPLGRYYFTRNQSTIFAFIVGGKYKPGNGVSIIAAHTDSPVLKVKPFSKSSRHGFHQVAVQCYGGGLWHTWFDRELSLAGRVFVQTSQNSIESRLVKINSPILRIPNLAIHLNREVNEKGFLFNTQTNLLPVLSTAIKHDLENPKPKHEETDKVKEEKAKDNDAENQTPMLLQILAKELKVEVGQIKNFELSLFDVQPPCLGGLYNEFIISRALDNLAMSYVAMRSLIDGSDQKSIENETNIRLIALFDNEEVGSDSFMGAGSNMMASVLQRIIGGDHNLYAAAIAKSFLVSADMAHALHPNYSDKHEEQHRPEIHKGLVIKENANQRYATSGVSSLILSEIAKRHHIPFQRFVVRNDMGCGSTIGPILASNTSLRTVDVGIPQLAMHSIREMCGTSDFVHAVNLMSSFFQDFPSLDSNVKVD